MVPCNGWPRQCWVTNDNEESIPVSDFPMLKVRQICINNEHCFNRCSGAKNKNGGLKIWWHYPFKNKPSNKKPIGENMTKRDILLKQTPWFTERIYITTRRNQWMWCWYIGGMDSLREDILSQELTVSHYVLNNVQARRVNTSSEIIIWW